MKNGDYKSTTNSKQTQGKQQGKEPKKGRQQ